MNLFILNRTVSNINLSFFFVVFICLVLSPYSLSADNSKGAHLFTDGNLHSLFIFVNFPDTSTNPGAPWNYNPSSLPAWTAEFVDSIDDTKRKTSNLTHYFDEMSGGLFKLTGDIFPIPVTPKFNIDYYKSIKDVNSEILQTIDAEVDFSLYDNWSRSNGKLNIEAPDSTADMIFIIYRDFPDRLFFNNGWTGSAELYLNADYVSDEGIKISSGRMNRGSGIQVRGGKHGEDYIRYIVAHELGHYLLGAGHIEGGVTALGLMTGGPVWNAGRGMHSWEREKLGWTDYKDANLKRDSIYVLSDYMTTGDVLRIPLSDNEWFLLENRQNVSPHDRAGDQGLYIYHVSRPKGNLPFIDVECADGNWDFVIDTLNQNLYRSVENPTGFDEMNYSKRIGEILFACYKPVYNENAAWGDQEDAFDVRFNNVFSPHSNPSSKNAANVNFSIEVLEFENNNCRFKLYISDPTEGKPSKPQKLKLKFTENQIPILSWEKNSEPDLFCYRIYKSIDDSENFTAFQYVESTCIIEEFDYYPTEWMDNYFNTGSKSGMITYSITAVDSSGLGSVMANYIYIERDKDSGEWNIKNVNIP